MKNITTFLIVSLVCIFTRQAYSQATTNPATTIYNVKLLMSADTNSMTISSTAILFLQITNCSTNMSYSVGDYPMSNASLFLTNSAGKCYKLSRLRSPSWDKSFYHPRSHIIGPNEAYEWSLNLKIDENTPLGNYELKATRIVAASALNSTNRSSCELESNSLELQIK